MKKSDMPQTEKTSKNDKDYEKPVVAKTAYDLQRLKLMKLMKNPEKPILLPDRPKSKSSPSVPEFVRNVMGSSAGAGSGEFHVYRHLRRKEYSRQKFIQEKGRKETLDEEYHRKIEENKAQAETTTAKKRAKRLKKKQRQQDGKRTKQQKNSVENKHSENSHDESDTSEDENDLEGTAYKRDDDSLGKKDTLDDRGVNLRNKFDELPNDGQALTELAESEMSFQQKVRLEKTTELAKVAEKYDRGLIETVEQSKDPNQLVISGNCPEKANDYSMESMERSGSTEITSIRNNVNS